MRLKGLFLAIGLFLLPLGAAAQLLPATQDFFANQVGGTGFVPGVTQSLTIYLPPVTPAGLSIFFNGVSQNANTWTINGNVISFSNPIPSGTEVVEVKSASPGPSSSTLPSQCIASAYAGGTSDAITIPALPCGSTTNLVVLTAISANQTSTPTFQPFGLPARTIIRQNGAALAPGDIAGAGYRAFLNPTGLNWILLNPATLNQPVGPVIGTVTTQGGVTYTFSSMDCGTEVVFTSSSSVTSTIPATLPQGCNISVLQAGAGKVSVNGSAVASAALESAHSYTSTYGQWAIIGLNVEINSGGDTAVVVLTGDGS
jgi:hypothetical protein